MSRKSRGHLQAARRRNLQGIIAAAVLMALCILAGAGLIWSAANLLTISREDAHPVKATFRQAVAQWRKSVGRRYARGYQQTGLILQFSDHDDMEVRFNWDDVAVEEELPYTDKRYRSVLLSDLCAGMACTMLIDPKEPDNILHLETEDGQVIVSFEASMESVVKMRASRYILGLVLIGSGLMGGMGALWRRGQRMRRISGTR